MAPPSDMARLQGHAFESAEDIGDPRRIGRLNLPEPMRDPAWRPGMPITDEDLYGARVEYRRDHGVYREIFGFPRRPHISWTAPQSEGE